MLDYNILKENADEVKKYKQLEEEFEINGQFDQDTDNPTMDGCLPVTEEFPFIRKGFKLWLKHKICLSAVKKYSKLINANLSSLKIVGKENLKGVKGAIVTCNHISKIDSFAVRAAVGYDLMYVAADFNNWDNPIGELGRHTGYLPLSTSLDRKVMRKFNEAMGYYLEKKHKKVLIYPEQAMWRDYKKPRPLKDGAFHYAVKHKVPILPLFITIEDKTEKIDELNRVNFGNYTIHILKPIYPKEDLSNKENLDYLRQTNYNTWKDLYESTYGIPLEYSTKDKSKIKI